MLLLDNAPGNPSKLGNLNKNVEVIFLPPNTTSLLQPMDQGVIATFKAYYLRRTFSQAIDITAAGINTPSLPDFWKSYNIKNTIDNINASWLEITHHNMKVVWKNILQHCSSNFTNLETEIQQVSVDIVNFGNEIGFDALDITDVCECIESHSESLSDTDLLNIEQ